MAKFYNTKQNNYKDAVHPLVEYLRKEELEMTWQDFGSYLSNELSKKGHDINISPGNARNFACFRSTTWWFWSLISELVVSSWVEKRTSAQSIEEFTSIDIFYSSLFSESFAEVYRLWHSLLFSQRDEDTSNFTLSALELAEHVFNETRIHFDIDDSLIQKVRIEEIDDKLTELRAIKRASEESTHAEETA